MKVTYRPFEWPDIPRALELGQMMHDESPFFSQFEFDPDEAAQYMAFILMNPDAGFSIIAEDDEGKIIGGILASISKVSMCKYYMADAVITFVEPDHRKGMVGVKLIKAFEKWAYDQNLTHTSIGFTTGINVERMLNFYDRIGYDIISYKHCKELH